MSRRLEVELTSKRDDGSYTWRQAGAKQPKGDLDGSLMYEGAKVGDIVRVDADFAVDGVFITAVLPPKAQRSEKPKLEILGSGNDGGGVTTQLAGKGGRGRGDRDGKGRGRGRGDRDGKGRGRGDRDGKGRDGENRGGRDGAKGRGRGDRSGRDGTRNRDDQRGNSNRPRRERTPAKPKPKRLRAKRVHRDAVINGLPEMQRPLARIVLRDGVPGLRSLIEAQNVEAAAAGQLEIPPKILEAVGEHLLPRLRTAEWRDNAEAALAGIGEVDLRDIRKVVVAADNGAKDEESRALAQQLKDGLAARVEAEHGKWLSELDSLLKDGRTVRALRQSSRPPKAGSPLPADIAKRLSEAASAAMTADTMAERWGTVLDAVAFSPVRQQVKPAAIPAKVTPQLEATVKKLAKRIPHIATLFGAAPAAPKPSQPSKPAESRPVPPPPPVETAEAPAAPVATEVPPETPAAEAVAEQAPTEASADSAAPTTEQGSATTSEEE